MANKKRFAVILAGGGGTRLWPLSRRKKPKQFLKLFDNKSLLRNTIKRVGKAFSRDDIYIVTSKDLVNEVKKETGSILSRNILVEPSPKNTAAAIGLAAVHLSAIDSDATLSTFAADHYIEDERKFLQTLISSQEAAERGDYIVTIGIQPSSAATGYGYIHAGRKIFEVGGKPIFEVKEFKEKPNQTTASAYISQGDFFWNANINSYKVATLLRALNEFRPDLLRTLTSTQPGLKHGEVVRLWKRLPNESIDTAILEKASNVLMIPGNFSWVDVGDWNTVYSLLSKKKGGDVVIGKNIEHVSLDTRGCLIYGDSGVVATIGLKDVIVIKTDDVVLVSSKSRSQDVKKIIERLKKTKKEKFL
ncbi:mannose-1-phosphate guanylyltransferase [Patescibacteria group bacterium]|nr:mannose-1-phosphate guanylyltransferase [Patescibacteria group bacterium]